MLPGVTGDFRMGQLKLSLPPSCLTWQSNPNMPAYECVSLSLGLVNHEQDCALMLLGQNVISLGAPKLRQAVPTPKTSFEELSIFQISFLVLC